MEELVLTTPEVIPEKVTAKYKVTTLTLNWEYLQFPETVPGLVAISLRNEHEEPFYYQYTGQVAKDYIKFLNTGNFTVKSVHKRILEKLSSDGILPGTVTGTPDP